MLPPFFSVSSLHMRTCPTMLKSFVQRKDEYASAIEVLLIYGCWILLCTLGDENPQAKTTRGMAKATQPTFKTSQRWPFAQTFASKSINHYLLQV